MENKPIFSLNAKMTSNQQLPLANTNKSFLKPNDGIISMIKKRHVLTFYAFFGFFFAYAMRANLSVAIVDMTKMSKINKKPDDILTSANINNITITSTTTSNLNNVINFNFNINCLFSSIFKMKDIQGEMQ